MSPYEDDTFLKAPKVENCDPPPYRLLGRSIIQMCSSSVPVYFAMLSSSRGYLVSRCISMGMMSLS